MLHRLPRFVADTGSLDQVLLDAKHLACPRCHRIGMLIGHGLLLGYAPQDSERVVRGRRLLCSKRHRRSGCGRTWSVRVCSVISGFSVRTSALSGLLAAVVAGAGIARAWWQQASGLSARSGYRLWRRLLAGQVHLRTTLCLSSAPPPCDDARPVAQMLGHLRQAVGTASCVLGGFQLTFQRSVFG